MAGSEESRSNRFQEVADGARESTAPAGLLAVFDVPDADGPIPATGRHERSVTEPADGSHGRRVTGERGDELLRGEVEHLGRVVAAGGHHPPRIG